MKKSYIVLFVIILVPCLFMLWNNRGVTSKIEDNIVFNQRLSEYGIYQGKISELTPCDEAIIIDISSPLFTDYAEKQRIILLPKGEKIKANGRGLPDFPDGTIIAKTFFYPERIIGASTAKYILETRLLIKSKSQWNATTYKWNDTQDEAYLLQDGATVPIAFVDEKGKNRTIGYKIPSRADCISYHRQNDKILPIGPKLRNINIDVNREQQVVNQLEYLKQKGKLEITSNEQVAPITNYRDELQPIENRARAYLDINCAHCHNPNGIAYYTQLDLRDETPLNQTEIWLKQGKIATRMSMLGELHMPKVGTTIIHDEGLQLVVDYIKNLSKKGK